MREIPDYFENKRKTWKRLAHRWFGISNVFGVLLVVFYGSIVALGCAAPWPRLRWRIIAIILPILAAVVSFLSTTFAAQVKGTACELAAREIEEAAARYRTNISLAESFLGEAEARGVRLLSLFKLN